MDVIAIGTHLFKLNLVTIMYLAGDPNQLLLYLRTKQRFAILYRKHDRVMHIVRAVPTLYYRHAYRYGVIASRIYAVTPSASETRRSVASHGVSL